jgi:ABC-type sugar transport system ATPase subunit
MTTQTVQALQVQGLENSYDELRVLRGVDFDVARGSICALLGSNGAGRTRVVKILSTLLKPDAGTATVAGFDVATHPANVRESISLTGQFAAVDEILTGRENLILMARLRRVKDAGQMADDLLARFQLSWSWATLTSVNNAAWFAYFVLLGYWAALVPACSASLLGGRACDDARPARTGESAAGGPDQRLGRAPCCGVHRRRRHRPWDAAHGCLHPPGHAVDLDRLPGSSPHRSLTRNLAAGPGGVVLLDDRRRPPGRPTPEHARRYWRHRKPAHARPNPPHQREPTAKHARWASCTGLAPHGHGAGSLRARRAGHPCRRRRPW